MQHGPHISTGSNTYRCLWIVYRIVYISTYRTIDNNAKQLMMFGGNELMLQKMTSMGHGNHVFVHWRTFAEPIYYTPLVCRVVYSTSTWISLGYWGKGPRTCLGARIPAQSTQTFGLIKNYQKKTNWKVEMVLWQLLYLSIVRYIL